MDIFSLIALPNRNAALALHSGCKDKAGCSRLLASSPQEDVVAKNVPGPPPSNLDSFARDDLPLLVARRSCPLKTCVSAALGETVGAAAHAEGL